ncbi:MAG: HD-GYP domain-containing protein [Actinobacteria bacterium]|nr:HD-GYP domain-containing protein [Actinomycetota bacterium]
MGNSKPVTSAERRNRAESPVVGGYMMHSAQSRRAMAKLAFGQQLFTIAIIGALAVHQSHFTAVTGAVIAICAAQLPMLRMVRWQSLPPLSFVPYLWFSVLIYVVIAFDFGQPDVLLSTFTTATLLTSAFWYRRSLMLAHLGALLAVVAAASLLIDGREELAAMLLTLPLIALFAIRLGSTSNHYILMVLRRRRFRATITSLLHALHARDGYTAEHSETTLRMAAGVADQLGLDAEARNQLTDIALLHDIGKIGIPNSILHKPGKLDEREWEIMRQHPVIGEKILADVPGFDEIARSVRHEHERWDGQGYPDGIAGDEIPLASRIVLVCDAYHAMTSDRPYRKAMSESDAREELERNAGTQFDPAVVAALLRALDDGALFEASAEDLGIATEDDLAHTFAIEPAADLNGSAPARPAEKQQLVLAKPDREEDEVDPGGDQFGMMRAAVEIWLYSVSLFGVYLVAFSKLDTFGVVIAAIASTVGLASAALMRHRPMKSWYVVTAVLAYVVVSISAWHYQEPALLLFLVMPTTSAAAYFWHSRPVRVVQIAAATAVFLILPIVIAGWDELARALVGTRAFVGAIIAVGYFSRRMSAMEFERERFSSTASSLLMALHARDGYTAVHSDETVEMAMAVATRLELGAAERDELANVAVLHDIGKIGIPDEILHKPGKLNDAEWELMRQHPVIGEQIVGQVPGFEAVAHAIRHEHERWDGKGYPDGLDRANIPLPSRIVLVCDAYHAMTSDRPYRASLGDAAARAELVANAGAQFDPVIVTALIEALDAGFAVAAPEVPEQVLDVEPVGDARRRTAA